MSETPHSTPGMDHRAAGSQPAQSTRSPHPRNPHAQDSLRDVGIVAAILFGIVMVIGGVWMYQARENDGERPSATTAATRQGPSAKPVAARTRPAASAPLRPASMGPSSAKMAPRRPEGRTAFDVHFASGGSALSPAAKRVLDREAARMKQQPDLAVLIHGHADSRGARASNRALGRKRALAVQEHLVEAGVPKASIQVFSLGEAGPLCRVDEESCHRKNRRVHVEWKARSGAGADSGRQAAKKSRPETGGSRAEADGPTVEQGARPPKAGASAKS